MNKNNLLTYKVVKTLSLTFLFFFCFGGWASCTADNYVRTQSPGYRYHEIQIRLDDDNGALDSVPIHAKTSVQER
jgi:hypothetical protein